MFGPALVVASACAASAACSLFIPFDDYPGVGPATEAGTDAPGNGDGPTNPDGAGDAGPEGGCKDLDTDPQNCGACGRVCQDGPCEAGRCPISVVFQDSENEIESIVATEVGGVSQLYVGAGRGFVSRVTLADGSSEASNALPSAPKNLVKNDEDDASVVVAAVGRQVRVFPVGGFPASSVLAAARFGLGAIYVHDDVAYWGCDAGLEWASPVTAADASISTVADSAADPPIAISRVAGNLLWLATSGAVFSMATASPGVASRIMAAPLGATRAAMTANKKFIYIAKTAGLTTGVEVYGIADLNAPRSEVNATRPEVIAADEDFLYVVDFRTGAQRAQLVRTRADGGGRTVLANNFARTTALALDSRFVYFGDGTQVLRTSK